MTLQPRAGAGHADTANYYAARAAEYDISAGYMDSIAEGIRAPIKARFQEALQGHDVLEIACGTGYWTAVIADAARSVLATDIDPAMIALARKRLFSVASVRCEVADAYSLEGISGPFTAAFSHWWWSHVPKSRIRGFLTVLHARLVPGAFVLFADQLPYEWLQRRRDAEGNWLEKRTLRDGREFEIVKNFPTEQEVLRALSGIADQARYQEYAEGRYWTVSYRTREHR